MANIMLMVPKYKVENRALFPLHSGDVYVQHFESEDSQKEIMFVWATSPTTSHFNDMPIGSILFNIAASGLAYYKQAASTWVELGDLT